MTTGGWTTNGLPAVTAPLLNTTTLAPPGGQYTNLAAAALVAADTELASGQSPQTVATTAFQIAALAGALIQNTATSTVHAVTLNTRAGHIYTESLSTAAGADYTFTLTNSLLTTSTAAPIVAIHAGTDTAAGFAVKSVVNGSGSSVMVFTNTGTAAANGTWIIDFHV